MLKCLKQGCSSVIGGPVASGDNAISDVGSWSSVLSNPDDGYEFGLASLIVEIF
jgi:hypothetical protein